MTHISNEEVRRRTDQPSLTHIIRTARLKFFGHIARADPSMDHSRAVDSDSLASESTVEPLGQSGSSAEETETAGEADRVTPAGSGPLNPI